MPAFIWDGSNLVFIFLICFIYSAFILFFYLFSLGFTIHICKFKLEYKLKSFLPKVNKLVVIIIKIIITTVDSFGHVNMGIRLYLKEQLWGAAMNSYSK